MVENLRPIDSVGVLIFDNSFQWAVPLRKAEDRATIKKLIAGITPDGGTQIAPALSERLSEVLASLRGKDLTLLMAQSDMNHSRELIDAEFMIERGANLAAG